VLLSFRITEPYCIGRKKFFLVIIFSFTCLLMMKCGELVEFHMTFLAVVLNYKLRLLSMFFLSLELLLVFFPTCAYIF